MSMDTEQAPTTISGVKVPFTAKGYAQPEIIVRYATAEEAKANAVTDAMAVYDDLVNRLHARGIRLVTEVEG